MQLVKNDFVYQLRIDEGRINFFTLSDAVNFLRRCNIYPTEISYNLPQDEIQTLFKLYGDKKCQII